ncbi:unnamed protein product, partial [Symbiodinium sp. CCMP2456]
SLLQQQQESQADRVPTARTVGNQRPLVSVANAGVHKILQMLKDTRLTFGTLGISYFGNDVTEGRIRPEAGAAWEELMDLGEEEAQLCGVSVAEFAHRSSLGVHHRRDQREADEAEEERRCKKNGDRKGDKKLGWFVEGNEDVNESGEGGSEELRSYFSTGLRCLFRGNRKFCIPALQGRRRPLRVLRGAAALGAAVVLTGWLTDALARTFLLPRSSAGSSAMAGHTLQRSSPRPHFVLRAEGPDAAEGVRVGLIHVPELKDKAEEMREALE